MTTRTALTLRYALALSLVASSLVAAHLVQTRRIVDMTRDAGTVNVSGMQRMLSQRIALLARELSLADDPSTSERLAGKLATALDTMEDNHERLSADWRVRAERGDAAYAELTGANGLDAKVRGYIASGRSLLEPGGEGARAADRHDGDAVGWLARIARNGFLAELDAVVSRYERESVERADVIGRIARIAMVAGLALLLFEAGFIFRPMVRRVTATIAELERVNVKLEEANEELAQFNYRVSHDIVSPIASARGYLELAIAEVEDDEPDLAELAELMNVARGQLDRLDALVVDLASLARAGMDESRVERIELKPLVDALWVDHLEATLDGLALETDLALAEIDGDPVRVRQILSNLIDNAVKCRDPSRKAPRVTVSSRRVGDRVVLEVRDDGIGIDPAFGERAFDMFARGDASVPGNGLGLYIVGKHVGRLGGTLSIASFAAPTVLRVSLPIPLTPT